MPNIETLAQAQEEILRLETENTELRNERDTLSQNNESLTRELNETQKLNQKYFNQLRAQNSDTEDENDDDDQEVPSCEEFAKTLNY